MPRIKVDQQEPDVLVNSQLVSKEAPVKAESTPAPEVVPAPEEFRTPTDKDLQKVSGSPTFSAFSAFPAAVKFEGEDDDEEIILLMRAHLVTNIKWLLIALGMVVAPLILFPLIGSVNLLGSVGPGTGLIILLLWYAVTFTYAFINFLYWYFNVYIVTNERVVDVDWYSIIYHKTSSTRIAKIQDVSATRSGVFAGIFDYGDIHIQTAAEEANFEFLAVPHPQLVKNKIDELMEEEEKEWEVKPNG